MPTEKTITYTLYEYDELPTDRAKEKAREWFVSGDEVDLEFVLDNFRDVCSKIGIEIHKERSNPWTPNVGPKDRIYYSLGNSQGDYGTFAGIFRPAKDALEKIKEEFPQDEKLHSIAERTSELANQPQEEDVEDREAIISCERRDTRISVSAPDKWEKQFEDIVEDLQSWYFKSLQVNHEYQQSEESVSENIRINNYTFLENGERKD